MTDDHDQPTETPTGTTLANDLLDRINTAEAERDRLTAENTDLRAQLCARYAQSDTVQPRCVENLDDDARATAENLLANTRHALAGARDDDERAEAISMLLDAWYDSWHDSPVTAPHDPIAAALVRLLRPQPSQGQDIPGDQLAAIHANATYGIAAWESEAVRDAARQGYRVGFAAALGCPITIGDLGDRLEIGDRPEPALPPPAPEETLPTSSTAETPVPSPRAQGAASPPSGPLGDETPTPHADGWVTVGPDPSNAQDGWAS